MHSILSNAFYPIQCILSNAFQILASGSGRKQYGNLGV